MVYIISRLITVVFYLLTLSGIYRFMAKVFKYTASTGKGSDVCLEMGFLPVPVHFYSPLPDIKDLEQRNIWSAVSNLSGIDFRIEAQTALLSLLGNRFGGECCWPLRPTDDPAQFYLQNSSFSYGCAASTYCMIRQHKPANVIEIGSGMSSRVIAAALTVNRREDSQCSYVIIDPYPGELVSSGCLNGAELVRSRVELLETEFFERLQAGDILFIDSSHSVKIGGDVNNLFLDILPCLAPGVVVHIHDISLPYEYPRAYATNESFRQFWTEQYLLQGFLSFNSEFEVLLGMNYLMVDHAPLFKEVFPHYSPNLHPFISGSFWIRRMIPGQKCEYLAELA